MAANAHGIIRGLESLNILLVIGNCVLAIAVQVRVWRNITMAHRAEAESDYKVQLIHEHQERQKLVMLKLEEAMESAKAMAEERVVIRAMRKDADNADHDIMDDAMDDASLKGVDDTVGETVNPLHDHDGDTMK